jgi:hypothetical protein
MKTKKPLIRKILFSAKRTILLSYQTVSLFNWYLRPKISLLIRKTFFTGEYTNFTYDLTEKSLRYLAHNISLVTDRPVGEVVRFISEGQDDKMLKEHLNRSLLDHGMAAREDVRCAFGRRLGWYALARILRPRVIVETGVDKGHGSILLCAALLKNAGEGYPGRYFGLDIAASAGWLLAGEYARVGEIVYGDSIRSLENFNGEIDMFINDSDHSADYEFREYQAVLPKLSSRAIILGDNAHATDRLCKFSEETGRQFLFFREEPTDHWYFGAGIGISFNRPV